MDPVTKRILSNGMTVLVREDHSAPVATVNVWVKTGYFDDPDSLTGISHLLEHLFFKGTPTRPVGRIQDEVKSVGGYWNAGTIYDHTNYYITVPSAEISRALDIEADALLNSLFDAAEISKEQEVVIQEIKRKYDTPSAMCWERMMALSFTAHRLGRWRMGTPEQIRAMSRDFVVGYYSDRYRPENIVLAVAGDVSADAVMPDIERLFGSMPRGTLVKDHSPEEPRQTALRYRRDKADITQAYIEIGFHAPAVLDEDEQAAQILAQLFGAGKSSRLYRELKERSRLVNAVGAGYYALPGAGALYIEAELETGNLAAAEQAIFAQIERIKNQPPTEAELRKVKTAIEYGFISSMEDVSEQASNLAYYESLGDYRLLDEYIEKLRAVTAEDVQNAARKYLRFDGASIEEYVPENIILPETDAAQLRQILETPAASAAIETNAPVPSPHAAHISMPGNSSGGKDAPPALYKLSNGISVIIVERRRLPVASVGIYFPGGRLAETPKTAGLTKLMLRTTLKGTATRTAEQVQDEIESLGTSIGASAGPDYVFYTLSALSRNIPAAMEILSDVILNPAFPPDEIEKERETQIAMIRRNQDSMYVYPFELARRAAFGDHPYGISTNGYEENLPGIGRNELLKSYMATVAAAGMLIVVCGDVEAGPALEMLEKNFGAMSASAASAAKTSAPVFSAGAVAVGRKKAQTAQVFAFPAPSALTEQLAALNILRNVASGMGGRLYDRVREKNNLAYTVASFLELNRTGGLLLNYAATSPENEEMAREMMLDEWNKMAAGDISPEEFENARRYTVGIYQIGLQTNDAVRDQLAHNMLMGRGLGFMEKYPSLVMDSTIEQVKAAAAEFSPAQGIALGAVQGE